MIYESLKNAASLSFLSHHIVPRCFYSNKFGKWRAQKIMKVKKPWFNITVDVEVFGSTMKVAEAVVVGETVAVVTVVIAFVVVVLVLVVTCGQL